MTEWREKALVVLGAGFIAFQVYLIWGAMGVIPQRVLHVCFALLIVIVWKPLPQRLKIGRVIDILLLLSTVTTVVYVLVSHDHIETRLQFVDRMTGLEVGLGVMMILGVLEATRRALGLGLTVVVSIFIAYYFLGSYMPGLLSHKRASFLEFVESNFISSTGMFGTPVGVSVQDVFYFMMFGSFLAMSGGALLLNDLAIRITGRSLGGPAKTSVVGSALFGMISGSAVANVAVDGVFTISLMKRVGYPPKVAAAIEALASTGGQLMPPVMGAGAFVLAEMTRTPYLMVCKAAAMPSIAFYLALFAWVHFMTRGLGVRILTKEDITAFSAAILPRLHLLIPIAVLIVSIATWSSLMTAAFRASVVALFVGFLARATRPGFSQILEGIADLGKQAATVAIPCAAAGIIVGSLTMTGAGLKLTDLLLSLTGGMLLPTIALTIVACIVLGMGMPTTAAYIMAAVLMGPALVKLGFPMLVAHMFIFYFAILSMVTPPVAVAAYAAAGIAGADMWETGWEAFRMSLPSFLIPLVFLWNHGLLLEHPSLLVTIRTCAGTFVAMFAMAAALTGWMRVKLNVIERIALFASGIAVIFPQIYLDLAGMATSGVIYFGQRMKQGKLPARAENPPTI